MWTGRLKAIFIAPGARAAMVSVPGVTAIAGMGLEGDRYALKRGSLSRWPGPHREVTLISEEALQEMAEQTSTRLSPEETRRNLLTIGVPLNDLIRQTFSIGEVVLLGLQPCHPCAHLARLTGKPDVVTDMARRGGLRARILRGGYIEAGCPIAPIVFHSITTPAL